MCARSGVIAFAEQISFSRSSPSAFVIASVDEIETPCLPFSIRDKCDADIPAFSARSLLEIPSSSRVIFTASPIRYSPCFKIPPSAIDLIEILHGK